jgi:iron complex transport system substrate-binding protein
MHERSWRVRLTALFALLLIAGPVAGCGSGKADEARSQVAGGPSAFPVTIAHKYGSTTIKAEPKRIVTVGLTDQDAVLALGKAPVGTTEWFGGFPGAIAPWATGRLHGAPLPTVLKDTGTGPQVEKIAALRPDLILAVYGGLTEKQYTTLSKFAPVVAQPKQYADFGVPWDEQTRTIGQALGLKKQADALVAGVQGRFAAIKKANPEFAGKTAVTATPYEGYFVYGSQDPRSRTLTSLGFGLPAGLDKLIGDKYGANISKERTDLLDQQVIVWTVPNLGKDVPKLHADKLYADLGVVKQGREIAVGEDTPYGSAYSFVTVLSLPYLLDRLVPQLKAAVDGDPGTQVAQVTS